MRLFARWRTAPGPEGYTFGPVTPGAFPDRGAATRYTDVHGDRPCAQPLQGFPGLQLRNGVADLARRPLRGGPGLFRSTVTNPNRHVLPGDRQLIPPSPEQVQQWAAATAGSQPQSYGGNGSVLAGLPMAGGAY